jgi:hypothetical protein
MFPVRGVLYRTGKLDGVLCEMGTSNEFYGVHGVSVPLEGG